jgi:hypothetical protein
MKGAIECYVDKVRGPQGVWLSWKAGNIAQATPHEAGTLVNKPIRLGAYGDPGAVPTQVWVELLKAANGRHTAYTHYWRKVPELMDYVTASIDPDDYDGKCEAQALGWHTYSILAEGEQPGANEIMCPEETRGIECANCGICSGQHGQKNITIPAIT